MLLYGKYYWRVYEVYNKYVYLVFVKILATTAHVCAVYVTVFSTVNKFQLVSFFGVTHSYLVAHSCALLYHI